MFTQPFDDISTHYTSFTNRMPLVMIEGRREKENNGGCGK
jgi:hypothetical protein